MKQPGVLLVLVIFVAAVSFVVASEDFKTGRTKVQLSGMNVVSNLGDADGSGTLKFTVRADEGKFCYDLSVSNISSATSATLNFGSRGATGQQVATLQAPAKGSSADCVSLDADRIDDITRNPANYYVSVENAEFPNGAIRGQLK
jgi:hypothetical protein